MSLFGGSTLQQALLFGGAPKAGSTGGLFGNAALNGTASFGNAAPGGSTFGNPTLGGSSLFGNTTGAPQTGFGALATAQPALAGGVFGSLAPAQPAFGAAPAAASTAAPAASGGLFGAAKPAATPSNSLFGAAAAPAASGSLFGAAKPAATPSNSLFGAAASAAPAAASGTLFGGAAAAPPTGGLFGAAKPSSTGLFGNQASQPASTFGAPAAPAQPPTAPAQTLDGNPYRYNPSIFAGTKVDATKIPPAIIPPAATPAPYRTIMPPPVDATTPIGRKRTPLMAASPAQAPLLLNRIGLLLRRWLGSAAAPAAETTVKPEAVSVVSVHEPTPSTVSPNVLDFGYGARRKGRRDTRPRLFYTPEAGAIKKLVIRHNKPAQFRSINAEQALVKRQRVSLDGSNALVYDDAADEESESNEPLPASLPAAPAAPALAIPAPVASPLATSHTATSPSVSSVEVPASASRAYWCEPSPSALRSLTSDSLAAVDSFIVGRRGYGSVAFDYLVDLLALAPNFEETVFDRVVKFDRNTLQVYSEHPHRATKPSMGEELNVPATITLENIKPRDGQLVADFTRFLKQRPGTEYVLYDPRAHTWVFKVVHFSVWGLVDELDPVEVQMAKQAQDADEDRSQAEYSVLMSKGAYARRDLRHGKSQVAVSASPQGDGDSLYDEAEVKRARMALPTSLPGGWVMDVLGLSLVAEATARHNELVQRRISERLALAADSLSAMLQAAPLPPQSPLPEPDVRLVQAFVDANLDMDTVVAMKPFEPVVRPHDWDVLKVLPSQMVADDWVEQLGLAAHLLSLLAPPPAVSVARALDSILEDEPMTEVPVETVAASEPYPFPSADSPSHHRLAGLLQRSEIVSRANDAPQVEAREPVEFADLVQWSSADAASVHYWRLCSVLYDRSVVDGSAGMRELVANGGLQRQQTRFRAIERRRAVAAWAVAEARPELERRMTALQASGAGLNRLLDMALVHLCCGEVDRAVEQALALGSRHLAAMLTMLGLHDPGVQVAASAQLKAWKQLGAVKHVPVPILKMHQLLTGDVFDTLVVDVMGGLLWAAVLAVLLQYGDTSVGLSETLALFVKREARVLGDLALATIGMFTTGAAASSLPAPVETQWLVLRVLDGVHVAEALTQQYAAELEQAGRVVESLFVLAHTASDAEAAALVERVVTQRIGWLEQAGDVERCVARVRVSRRVVDRAIALQFQQQGNHRAAAAAFLDAGCVDEAHAAVVEHVGPAAVVAGHQHLGDLAALLRRFPHTASLESWAGGAGVYEAYARLRLDPADEPATGSTLEQLLVGLPKLQHGGRALNLMARAVADACLDRTSGLDAVAALPLGACDRTYIEQRVARLR